MKGSLITKTFTFHPEECNLEDIRKTLGFLHETSPFKPKWEMHKNGKSIIVHLNDESEIAVFFKVYGMVEQHGKQVLSLDKTILVNKIIIPGK